MVKVVIFDKFRYLPPTLEMTSIWPKKWNTSVNPTNDRTTIGTNMNENSNLEIESWNSNNIKFNFFQQSENISN